MSYHFIIRDSDGRVLDHRPATPGIMDVLTTQVIANEGGAVDDYQIVETEPSADQLAVLADDRKRPVLNEGRDAIESFEWVKTLADHKAERVAEVKALAAAKLRDMDWRTLRFVGQWKAGRTTKDSEADFVAHETAKDDVRSLSDQIEAAVNACETIDAVLAVDVSGLG